MAMAENHPDPLDRASDEADAANQEAVRVQREKMKDMPSPRADGLCVDCEEDVEPGRLKVGLGRCLSCQQDHETQMARFRGQRRG